MQDILSLAGSTRQQRFTAFYLPAILSLPLLFLQISPITGNLIASIAIFAGFLINSIILTFSLIEKVDAKTNDEYVNYLDDFTEHALYSLYVAIIADTFLIASSIGDISFNVLGFVLNLRYLIDFIAIYFTIHFFIILLRVVGKIKQIFDYNVKMRN